MKKVGILTQYYKSLNYGGLLQAFALQTVISSLGYDCKQICIDPVAHQSLSSIISSEMNAKLKFLELLKCPIKKLFRILVNFRLHRKIGKINAFSNKIPHTEKEYIKDSIANTVELFDVFVVGSDVVWNNGPNYSHNVFSLSFVPNSKKKISYAASIGSTSIPDGWTNRYLDNIKNLDAISVREKSIAEELQELIPNQKVHCVLDPTLLLTASEWEKQFHDPQRVDKYLLMYILGKDKTQFSAGEMYSKRLGLDSYSFLFTNYRCNLWQNHYGDILDDIADPFDFAVLIKNADVIVTDSFHAVVFSVIFHKPFYAFVRNSDRELVGRIESFLGEIGLSTQLITAEKLSTINAIPDIDFSYADKVISEKREYSLKYLKDNLG